MKKKRKGKGKGRKRKEKEKKNDGVNTGVVEGVVFQPITDYGTITTSANITIDYGTVNEAGKVPDI